MNTSSEFIEIEQSIQNWTNNSVLFWISKVGASIDDINLFKNSSFNGKWLANINSNKLKRIGIKSVGCRILLLYNLQNLLLKSSQMENFSFSYLVFRILSKCNEIIGAVEQIESFEQIKNNNNYWDFISRDTIIFQIIRNILTLNDKIRELVLWIDFPPFSNLPDLVSFKRHLLSKSMHSTKLCINSLKHFYMPGLKQIKIELLSITKYAEKLIHQRSDSIVFTSCSIKKIEIPKDDLIDENMFKIKTRYDNSHLLFKADESKQVININAAVLNSVMNGDEIIEVDKKIIVCWKKSNLIKFIRSHPKDTISLVFFKRPSHAVMDLVSHLRKQRLHPISGLNNVYQKTSPRKNHLLINRRIMNSSISSQNSDFSFASRETEQDLDNSGNLDRLDRGMNKHGSIPPESKLESINEISQRFCISTPATPLMGLRNNVASLENSMSTNIDELKEEDLSFTDNQVFQKSLTNDRNRTSEFDLPSNNRDNGQSDFQGWLFLKKSNSVTSKYVKRWCVYKNDTLYYHRNETDEVAEGLILLRGFIINLIPQVKSGRYRFKIFNDWIKFVFACTNELDRDRWIKKLHAASMSNRPSLTESIYLLENNNSDISIEQKSPKNILDTPACEGFYKKRNNKAESMPPEINISCPESSNLSALPPKVPINILRIDSPLKQLARIPSSIRKSSLSEKSTNALKSHKKFSLNDLTKCSIKGYLSNSEQSLDEKILKSQMKQSSINSKFVDEFIIPSSNSSYNTTSSRESLLSDDKEKEINTLVPVQVMDLNKGTEQNSKTAQKQSKNIAQINSNKLPFRVAKLRKKLKITDPFNQI